MRDLFMVVVLIGTLVSQGIAQLPFGPEFHLSQYQATEGETEVVRLSASFLTRPQVPPFNGRIEVDITAEDLPSGDPRQNAEFGSDYAVNRQNASSRTFTVTFQSKQANSTENVIQVAGDDIVEGSEAFRLRIVDVRFIGEAADIFRAQDGLTNTVADVIIEDDDFIEVSWIISEPIEVTEGEREAGIDGELILLELYAQAFGLYATPIEIGVVCAGVDVTGVPAALPGSDFRVLSGSTLQFTDVETLRSNSSNKVVLLILDDEIAEPCESFICTLQGGAVDRVRGIEPNRVTVRICDDDELRVRWARDVYVFDESQITGTVELVTDSTFEMVNVSIQGFPRQIPDGDANRFDSLVVPGPSFPGFAFNATIERAFVRVPVRKFGDRIFGNAQVTQSGRSDVVNTINDFVFTPNSTSAFENFTIVDDDVLEFDEIFYAVFSFGPEIANTWNARQVEPITACILIRDDDSVEVNFNEPSYCVAESDGQVSVSLRIDGQFFVPVWAVVEISDGTATDPEDYSSTGRYNVTFRQTAFTDGDTPTNTALSSPILIDITNDDIFEGMEYFPARIVETSDRFRVRIGQDTVNVTIKENVTVRYEEKMYSVDEEAGYVTLALVLERNASVPVTVTVRTLDLQDSSVGDAATASVDYIPRGPFDITFQPGSRRVLFNVTIVDDGIPESSEFFNADIVSAGPAEVIIGEPRQPVIEILDRVDNVTVRYEEEMYSVDEEAGYVTLALVLEGNVSVPVTVTVRTLDLQDSSVGDAATASVDYIPRGPFDITFQPGSRRVLFNVTIVDDGIPESSEFFNADIVSAGPGEVIIGEPRQPVIEILDRVDKEIRVNDTIIGDPLYEVPVIIDEENNTVSLCYEVHGEPGKYFNLISDTCVSVNALYSSMTDPSNGNIISKIGVLAEDTNGVCQEIEADLNNCTARVNGTVVTMYNQDGIRVRRRTNRIRISVPNCESTDLVMWVTCEVQGEQSMIKFVVARGFNLRPTSHGLIGQFWNIKVEAERYNVTAEDKIDPGNDHYAVTVTAPAGDPRQFFASKYHRTWDRENQTCLYAGDSQGYLLAEVTSLSGSVLEGIYDEYIVSGLFATDYKYEMFDSEC